MAIRKIVSRSISDDAVTADDLDNAVNTDINVLESNIAILGFYRASDNAKTVYNLVNQVIDEYTDSSGIASTTPSGLVLSGATGSKYYSSS
jgi:rRNA processing protein Krr1/Pno1